MSDYYAAEVSEDILEEYMNLIKSPKTIDTSQKAIARKQEIRMHIFTEVFAKYAAENANE